jgi:H+/Cl- antiporter ClcA
MSSNLLKNLGALLSERINNEKLRHNILQALPFWIASVVTGLVAVFYARLFAWAETKSFAMVHSCGLFIFLIIPACFVISWWLVNKFAKNARGSGIPQVMAAIELANPRDNHNIEGLLSIKTAVVKVLSSIILVLGGGAIGREGPTIQVAGSIFWKINQILPKSWPKISKRNMILTGAAAGLAAAFNTPLGGIVFAVEELAKTHIEHFKTAIFTSVIIAGLTAQGILGPYLYLGYPDVSNLSVYIFFYVAFVAVICGILGTLSSKAMLKILKWKQTVKISRFNLLYVIGVALVTATIAYFVSDTILGSGKSEMARLLFSHDKHGGWQLAVLRVVGPVMSFTTGSAGGVFAPALSSGAAVGSFVAQIVSFTGANANILILAGMVAYLTGITRSPFTSAILVLEMTDRHNVIFHLMLAGMIASLVAGMIQKQSFYARLEESYLEEIEQEEELAKMNAAKVTT